MNTNVSGDVKVAHGYMPGETSIITTMDTRYFLVLDSLKFNEREHLWEGSCYSMVLRFRSTSTQSQRGVDDLPEQVVCACH